MIFQLLYMAPSKQTDENKKQVGCKEYSSLFYKKLMFNKFSYLQVLTVVR